MMAKTVFLSMSYHRIDSSRKGTIKAHRGDLVANENRGIGQQPACLATGEEGMRVCGGCWV